MRFMVLVKPGYEIDDVTTIPELGNFEEMVKLNDEMVAAGAMLAGGGLQPTSKAVRIRYGGGRTTVVDGPFTETKELIGGFSIIEAESRDEAVEWMKRAPFGTGEVEIREIFHMEVFGDLLSPQTREHEPSERADSQGS